jgi:crossover junction endodeoxyribonuclease RusA
VRVKLTLPWPPAELNPNARPHYMRLAKAKKQYRTECALQAMKQGACAIEAERLMVHLVFVPPNRKSRDDQNCMAAMKAGLDGLADVLKVDDGKWTTSYELVNDRIGGFVSVEVRANAVT